MSKSFQEERNLVKRNIVSRTLPEKIDNFLDYFDNSNTAKQKFYVGKVVDNNDPDKVGRCRCRVYGIFDDNIPDADLPWAQPNNAFAGSLLGSFVVPPVGALVRVYFDNDEIYSPFYDMKITDQTGKSNWAANKNEDYPNSLIIFETDAGTYWKVNTASNVMQIRHSSGSMIHIDGSGNLSFLSAGKILMEAAGDIEISSGGNLSLAAAAKLSTLSGAVTNISSFGAATLGAPGVSFAGPTGTPPTPGAIPTNTAGSKQSSGGSGGGSSNPVMKVDGTGRKVTINGNTVMNGKLDVNLGLATFKLGCNINQGAFQPLGNVGAEILKVKTFLNTHIHMGSSYCGGPVVCTPTPVQCVP